MGGVRCRGRWIPTVLTWLSTCHINLFIVEHLRAGALYGHRGAHVGLPPPLSGRAPHARGELAQAPVGAALRVQFTADGVANCLLSDVREVQDGVRCKSLLVFSSSYEQLLQMNNFNQGSGRFFSAMCGKFRMVSAVNGKGLG